MKRVYSTATYRENREFVIGDGYFEIDVYADYSWAQGVRVVDYWIVTVHRTSRSAVHDGRSDRKMIHRLVGGREAPNGIHLHPMLNQKKEKRSE